MPDFSIENNYNNLIIAGIDEAGRGPLAGPVVASCVILNKNNLPKKIDDSKKISKKLRKEIFLNLKENCKFGVGIVDEKIIDEINILQATKLAMKFAFEDLQKKYQTCPEIILVDGNFTPFNKVNKIQEILPIIKGDQKSLSIAAASIIAKETRDEIMDELAQIYPQYGFEKHAGYPTKSHIEQIKLHGICEHHRQTFKPIKNFLDENN